MSSNKPPGPPAASTLKWVPKLLANRRQGWQALETRRKVQVDLHWIYWQGLAASQQPRSRVAAGAQGSFHVETAGEQFDV